jgi:hypothetical protein
MIFIRADEVAEFGVRGVTAVNLIVDITNLSSNGLATEPTNLLTCDRCHDVEEVVVAILRIRALNKTVAVCGHCMQEVPRGFTVI